MGFSIAVASLVAEPGLWSSASVVMAPALVALRHVGPSGSGIEPVTTALAGGLFTTEPPGKPLKSFEIETAHYKRLY